MSQDHRFRHPGSKNFQNVSKPSGILHFSNLSKEVTFEKVTDLMAEFQDLKYCNIVKHRLFSIESPENSQNIKIMMLIEFEDVEQAVKVMCVLHNQELDGKKIKLSFAKSTIKQASSSQSTAFGGSHSN